MASDQRHGNANAFSDVIEMGTNTQQTRIHHPAQGTELYQPSCSCPVERGASRDARHVRERLLEVIPGHQPDVISRFYLMAIGRPRMRASGTRFAVQIGKVGRIQSGCAVHKRSTANPPAGQRTKATRPIGCKARQVRVTRAGVGSLPVATPRSRRLTTSGVLPRKADREQLNDERGVKPLPVSDSRDGAESVKPDPGWIRGRFCILPPEIRPDSSGLETDAEAGALDMPGRVDAARPTNVTAVVKSQTNRARSVAAGVVSGAGSMSAGVSNAAL